MFCWSLGCFEGLRAGLLIIHYLMDPLDSVVLYRAAGAFDQIFLYLVFLHIYLHASVYIYLDASIEHKTKAFQIAG